MKLTKSAKVLLVKYFKDASGIHTDGGDTGDWSTLEAFGLVKRMPFGGMMGHHFCFEVTDKGRAKVKDLLARIEEGART